MATRVGIEWRDLVAMSAGEKVWELVLSLPWLIGSLIAYAAGWWALGAIGSFFFFLTGLRQSHNAQHYAMGLPRRVQDLVLVVLSVLMLEPMHAVQVTHMQHHRHCLDEQDAEAAHAGMAWWRVLLIGPMFPMHLTRAAWRIGSRGKRGWIALEIVLISLWGSCVWFVVDSAALRWHTAAMACGECFTAFFAVWSVHHGCDAHDVIARTQRGWLKNWVSYNMFYHLEHHLYPAVPTCHLPRLAKRLDAAEPGAIRKQVF